MSTQSTATKISILVSVLVCWLVGWFYVASNVWVARAQQVDPQQAPVTTHRLFLAAVTNGSTGRGTDSTPDATPTEVPSVTPSATMTQQATPTATPVATATATPNPVEGAWFMEPYTKTGGSDIKIDAQGGLHVAYRYHVPDREGTAAAYFYCPGPAANCADMQQWQGVKLLNEVREVQLELNAAGQPRLLIQTNSAQYPGAGEDYHYAECNSQCTDPQQWKTTVVATRYGDISSGISSYYLPDRYFALDPQGRPRFVYNDRNYAVEPDHYGVYYLWCDADCTQHESWHEALISQEVKGDFLYDYEILSFPTLTFTQAGAPRIVGDLIPLADASGERATGIYYLACDSGCDNVVNWQRVKIADRGQGPFPMWDIALDSADHPRVAFYKEDTLADDESGKRLHYLQCDSDCLKADHWQTLNLGLPREAGDGAALALDANDHPRIAYLDGSYNLGYSWCNGNCLDLANWQHGFADSEDGLETAYPIARPFTCDAGIWRTDSPAMALDQAGNPHIVYDAGYKARCLYEDPSKPGQTYYQFSEIWHAVRVVAFAQP